MSFSYVCASKNEEKSCSMQNHEIQQQQKNFKFNEDRGFLDFLKNLSFLLLMKELKIFHSIHHCLFFKLIFFGYRGMFWSSWSSRLSGLVGLRHHSEARFRSSWLNIIWSISYRPWQSCISDPPKKCFIYLIIANYFHHKNLFRSLFDDSKQV